MKIKQILGVSITTLALASCGPTTSTNSSQSLVADEESIEEFMGLIAESDEEFVELGLKNGKSKGNKAQKQKAVQKAKAKAEPVKAKAKATAQKKAAVQKKKAAAAKPGAQGNKGVAQKAKIKAKKLDNKMKKINKAISAKERRAKNLDKRKANIAAAMLSLQDIRKMPNKGLNELVAKCNAVAEAKTTLNETNSPKRPFDGIRASFLKALNKQRDAALKVNKVKSCGAAKNLLASLPPEAPIPVDIADLDIDAVDDVDAMPLDVADAQDFEAVDAELEADLEAEEELADAGGDMGMADGMNPAGDVNPPAAAPAVEAACIISQADGAKIYSNPSAKEAACKTTCDAFAASVPDRECSFGGVVFQTAQNQICVITSADGALVYNMMTSSGACKAKCTEFKGVQAGHSCSWAGEAVD